MAHSRDLVLLNTMVIVRVFRCRLINCCMVMVMCLCNLFIYSKIINNFVVIIGCVGMVRVDRSVLIRGW